MILCHVGIVEVARRVLRVWRCVARYFGSWSTCFGLGGLSLVEIQPNGGLSPSSKDPSKPKPYHPNP